MIFFEVIRERRRRRRARAFGIVGLERDVAVLDAQQLRGFLLVGRLEGC